MLGHEVKATDDDAKAGDESGDDQDNQQAAHSDRLHRQARSHGEQHDGELGLGDDRPAERDAQAHAHQVAWGDRALERTAPVRTRRVR